MLQWAGDYNTKEYKKKSEEQRRESFSFCYGEGVRQRLENKNNDANDPCETDSYPLKWDGEQDTEEYKKKSEEQRRESFAFCYGEGVRQRLENKDKDAHDPCEKTDSYALKWDGEQDTEEYKKKSEEQRRDSFAFCFGEDVRKRLEHKTTMQMILANSMIDMR